MGPRGSLQSKYGPQIVWMANLAKSYATSTSIVEVPEFRHAAG